MTATEHTMERSVLIDLCRELSDNLSSWSKATEAEIGDQDEDDSGWRGRAVHEAKVCDLMSRELEILAQTLNRGLDL